MHALVRKKYLAISLLELLVRKTFPSLESIFCIASSYFWKFLNDDFLVYARGMVEASHVRHIPAPYSMWSRSILCSGSSGHKVDYAHFSYVAQLLQSTLQSTLHHEVSIAARLGDATRSPRHAKSMPPHTATSKGASQTFRCLHEVIWDRTECSDVGKEQDIIVNLICSSYLAR